MAVNEKQTLRPTWGWLFALPALAGLAVWLSLLIAVAVAHLLDVGVPESWHWIFAGWLGLVGAIIFGTLALIAYRPAGPTATKARRIGLGLLATALVLVGLTFSGQAFAPIGAFVVLAVAAAALYRLWRRRPL
jgi:hypothetical protein